MRIAFINANLSGDPSAMDIAITLLATIVNQSGRHQASIIDLTFHRRDWQKFLTSELDKAEPDVVGISLNSLWMDYARQVGKFIHDWRPRQYREWLERDTLTLDTLRHINRCDAPQLSWYPQHLEGVKQIVASKSIPIIVGGHHASCHGEEVAAEPWVDRVCIGDWEDSILELLDGKQPGRQPFRENLDSLPTPDWTLWKDLDKYLYYLGGMMYVIGSRGCPHHCTFCSAPEIQEKMRGLYFRKRDPVAFAHELSAMAKQYDPYGLRMFQVFDPVFTIDPDWVKHFCEAKGHLDWCWPISVFARADQLDEERLEWLAFANCRVLRVGIEAGSERMRNEVYGKAVETKQIIEAARLSKRWGMTWTAFYILGGPSETEEEIKQTIALAKQVEAIVPTRSAFFIYKPFTEAGKEQVSRAGGTISQADSITFGVSVDSPILPAWKVEAYQRKAYLETFGRRWPGMVRQQGLPYFTNLAKYMLGGMADGLDPRYLGSYYHVYFGENLWS